MTPFIRAFQRDTEMSFQKWILEFRCTLLPIKVNHIDILWFLMQNRIIN